MDLAKNLPLASLLDISCVYKPITNNKKITIHGDGNQTRSMGHADDLARGTYLAIKSKKVNGKIINIGNDEEIAFYQA